MSRTVSLTVSTTSWIIRINRGIGADQQGVLRVLVGALFHHGCESGVVRVVVNAQIQEFPSELGIDFIPAIFAVSDDSTVRDRA